MVGYEGKEPVVVDEKKGKIPGQRVADEGVMYVGLSSHALSDEPPRKTRDWKGIAALVTALVAAAGFVWNKAEGCYDRVHNQAVQAASYEATAGKIEDLYVRVATLEHVMHLLPSLFNKKAADAEKLVGVLAPVKSAPEPPVGVTESVDAGIPPPAPPERVFQKSGLPPFQKLQMRVKGE